MSQDSLDTNTRAALAWLSSCQTKGLANNQSIDTKQVQQPRGELTGQGKSRGLDVELQSQVPSRLSLILAK